MRKHLQAFTLVEFVIVLAVFAILAAFAIPRFTSIETQARVSAIAALSNSIRGTSSLAHAQWMASGQPVTIEVEGKTISMVNGYPDVTRNGLPSALQDPVGFSTTFVPGAVIFKKAGAPRPEHCSVVYSSAAASTPPKIVLVTPDLNGC